MNRTLFQSAVADVTRHAAHWAERQVADLIGYAPHMSAAERLAGHLRIHGINADAMARHDGQAFCLLIITEPIDASRVIDELTALSLPAKPMIEEETHSVIETTWGGSPLTIVVPDPWFMGQGVAS